MTIFGKDLQSFFIAGCFRQGSEFDPLRASVKECLQSSIAYYANILSSVAAFVAFVFIIKAGYTMFTAFGDEAKYAEGKRTMLYAIIGFTISVLAYFIIHFFVALLGYDYKG